MQLRFCVCAAEEEQTGNNTEIAFRTILFWAMRGSNQRFSGRLNTFNMERNLQIG